MASTTFSPGTVVASAWLNDVNTLTYGIGDTSDAAKGDALIGVKQPLTGAVATTQHEINAREVNALDYMTDAQRADVAGDIGSISVTAAVQAAVTTGRDVILPEGTLLFTDMVTSSTKGQLIRGSGKYSTIIKVDSTTFNMSADGVLKCTSGEPGFILRDLTILFVQPDSTVRANYKQYPPAVHAVGQPRFVVENCRILQAWDGIKMTGNSGGVSIIGLDLFSYNKGIDIDGSLDSVRIERLHWYNFNATANQITVFYNAANYGLHVARADDLQIHGCLFIGGQAARFYQSASGYAFGNITNCDFDTNRGLLVEAGWLSGSGLFFSIGTDGYRAILQSGGDIRISSMRMTSSVESTAPLVEMAVTGTSSAYLQIGELTSNVTGDTTSIKAASSGAGKAEVQVNNSRFIRRIGSAETRPTIYLASGSRGILSDIGSSDKGAGAGNWLQIDADDQHIINDVQALGWGMVLPATWSSMTVKNIVGGASDRVQNFMTGRKLERALTGNLTAGAATVAHGVPAGNQRILSCSAYYRGTGGEMVPLTVSSIDGTNVNLTGGSGTAAYRVDISYSDYQQGW